MLGFFDNPYSIDAKGAEAAFLRHLQGKVPGLILESVKNVFNRNFEGGWKTAKEDVERDFDRVLHYIDEYDFVNDASLDISKNENASKFGKALGVAVSTLRNALEYIVSNPRRKKNFMSFVEMISHNKPEFKPMLQEVIDKKAGEVYKLTGHASDSNVGEYYRFLRDIKRLL